MRLEGNILAQLRTDKGTTSRELARLLSEDKSEVNSCLYSLESRCLAHRREDPDARNSRPLWFSGPLESGVAPAPLSKVAAVDNRNSARGFGRLSRSHTAKPPFVPTAEQQLVIEAPPDARLLIEAGPGTGKSETLVARLHYLLDTGGLSPAQMLILSFSVAAVKELKSRILRQAAGHSALAFVDIRTFDSFASRFLRQIVASDELTKLSYDERILRATVEIKKRVSAVRLLSGLKHVFLDEMQDLVGVRADFALALLRSIKPGFTLFGDSAQGIYDFTIDNGPSKTTSGDLINSIRTTFADLDDHHRFTKNHRVAGNSRLETIARAGRTLLLESSQRAREYLEREFGSLAGHGTTQNPTISSSLLNGSTCVVCRTNGQVLRLASQLLEKGIPFQLARDKNEFLAPAWLGRVFLGWPDDPVRKTPFLQRARSVLSVDEASAQSLWKALLAACAERQAVSFSLSDLRAAINDGVALPEHPLYCINPDAIHLSTIHRAKGREFGNVIVVINTGDEANHAKRGEDRKDDPSEPRVLFVALTRARDSLHRMEARSQGVWQPDERWVRTFPNGKGFIRLFSIQVGHARDVDQNSFAFGDPEEVQESQKWIVEHATPGTAVELWLNGKTRRYPNYKVMISRVHVGNMSEHFGRSLFYTMAGLNKLEPNGFPTRITGLWVKEIITYVGDLSCNSVDDSFRTSGLWISLALEGLGKCEWK